MVKRLWQHYFLPSEANNHKALLLQPAFISLFIIGYLLNQSLIKALTLIKPGVLGYSSEITTQKVVDLTNQQRRANQLPELKYNSILSQSATKKAQDMFANNYWAHNSPTGTSPWDFFQAEGYQYSIAGENLAKDFYDTDSMMKAWMKSPTHRANIVNPKYQEIGIGVVNGTLNGVKTTLVVQHFGTPLAAADIPQTPKTYQTEEITTQAKDLVAGSKKELVINPLAVSKFFGTAMFIFILSLIVVDAYYTIKNQTFRLAGSSAGHISFLLVIFLLLLFSRQGTIF